MSWQQSLISTSVSKVDLKPELQYVPPFVQSILQKLLSLPCGSLTVKTNWFISTRRKKRKKSRKKKSYLLLNFSHYLYACQQWRSSNIFFKHLLSSLLSGKKTPRREHTSEHLRGKKYIILEKKTKNICLRTHLARENEDCSYSHKVKLNNSQQVRPRAIQHIIIFQMAGTGP